MSRTVLLSEVNEAGGRFPEAIASVRDALDRAGIPRCGEGAVPLLAEQVEVNAEVREDLFATCEEVYARKPEISQLEMLGVLIVATAGPAEAGELANSAEMDGALRGLFNFVLASRRRQRAEVAGHELPPMSEAQPEPVPAKVSAAEEPFADAPEQSDALPARDCRQVEAPGIESASEHSGMLARALARAAREGEPDTVAAGEGTATEARALPVEEVPVPQAVRSHRGTFAARPVIPIEKESEPEEEPERVPRRWGMGTAATCGVLLGFGLGVFLHFDRGTAGLTSSTRAVNTRPSGPALQVTKSVDQLQAEIAAMDSVANMSPGATEGRGESRGRAVTAHSEAQPERVGRAGAAHTNGTVAARKSGVVNVASTKGVPQPVMDRKPEPAVERGVPAAPLPPTGTIAARPVNLGGGGVGENGREREAGLPRVTTGSAGIMAANLVSSPAPAYPIAASTAGVQGEVIVEAIVGRDGEVMDTRVVSGPVLLRAAALSAVQHWHYRPYEVDGKAIEVATTARLEFRLGQ